MPPTKSKTRQKLIPAAPGSAAAVAAFLAAIGREVRRHRAKRGMTRRQLAQASATSERYLAQIESGAGNPSASVHPRHRPGARSAGGRVAAGDRRAHRGARRRARSCRAGAGMRVAGVGQTDRSARCARRRRRPGAAYRAGRAARRRQVDARTDAGATSRLAVHRARPRRRGGLRRQHPRSDRDGRHGDVSPS